MSTYARRVDAAQWPAHAQMSAAATRLLALAPSFPSPLLSFPPPFLPPTRATQASFIPCQLLPRTVAQFAFGARTVTASEAACHRRHAPAPIECARHRHCLCDSTDVRTKSKLLPPRAGSRAPRTCRDCVVRRPCAGSVHRLAQQRRAPRPSRAARSRSGRRGRATLVPVSHTFLGRVASTSQLSGDDRACCWLLERASSPLSPLAP